MVIYDLDIIGIALFEAETQSPLIVYSDAPGAFTISVQSLKTVARRYPQILKRTSVVKNLQFSFSDVGDRFKPQRAFALKQCLCICAAERFYHAEKIYCVALNVKRKYKALS
jgi:hypothetical protein